MKHLPSRMRFWLAGLAGLVLVGTTATMTGARSAPIDRADGNPRPSFDVHRHGFAFTNSFRGWPWPLGQDSAAAAGGYGLCGGMSLAAADFYFADAQTPDLRLPPGPGSQWHAYLWVRQARSLGFLGYRGLRFMQWMALPDAGLDGTRARTFQALMGAPEHLQREGVLPLGLVYRRWREGAMPWHNHQVLAYGWSERSDGVVIVQIYDPNFPGRADVSLRLTPTRETGAAGEPPRAGYQAELIVPGRRDRPVRGVFRMGHVRRPVPQAKEPARAR